MCVQCALVNFVIVLDPREVVLKPNKVVSNPEVGSPPTSRAIGLLVFPIHGPAFTLV